MNTRRSRVRRVAKWAGVLLCVLIVALWHVSLWRVFGVNASPAFMVVLEGGVFWGFWECAPADGIVWIFGPAVDYPRRITPRFEWNPSGASTLVLPLWIPLVLLGLPSVLLWRLERRRPPAGHCAQCGYNLHGLTEPRCPECGTGFESESCG